MTKFCCERECETKCIYGINERQKEGIAYD